jgi:hypothetical protein
MNWTTYIVDVKITVRNKMLSTGQLLHYTLFKVSNLHNVAQQFYDIFEERRLQRKSISINQNQFGGVGGGEGEAQQMLGGRQSM